MKVLHINASPRNEHSHSLKLANYFLDEYKKRAINISIDRIDLFTDYLPEFGTIAANAKMALFSCQEQSIEEKKAWQEIESIFKRFNEADHLLFNVPIWNNSYPYILKKYIDIITQPGWAFGFDVNSGYFGLLKNKKATIIHSSGVYFDGISPNFGSNYSSPYIKDWLKFIGIDKINEIQLTPTVLTNDYDKTLNLAIEQANNIINNMLEN